MDEKELQERFPGIKFQEPLKSYCTFNVGGRAEYFYQARNKEALLAVVQCAAEYGIPYFVFGGGSNVVFPDEGIKGLVVKNLTHKIEVRDTQIIAESGAVMAQVLVQALQHHLDGLEELIGLPGTIGGAVRGNAGAYKTEIKDVLKEITFFDPKRGKVRLPASAFEFSYRESAFKRHPDWVILEVVLQLKHATDDRAHKTVKEILANRQGKQPGGYNTGSFFKNPSSDMTAGFLIDQCGLKGTRIGDAQISPVHANFFMNIGNATAKDILALRDLAKAKVKEKFGIELEEEVMIIENHH